MCGIIGISGLENIISDLYWGLLNMQHRGKESAGIAFSNPSNGLTYVGGMGEVPQALKTDLLSGLDSYCGIGHTRYSTTGGSNAHSVQPLQGVFQGYRFYLAHNGNLVNTSQLREKTGSQKKSSDTQVLVDLISQSQADTFEDALIEVFHQLKGSFCLVIIFEGRLYAVRDRYGFHPLQLGKRDDDIIIASESCVFDHLGGSLIHDIPPGTLITIDKDTWDSVPIIPAEDCTLKFDLFEYIYFLRPDSIVHDVSVAQARYNMGRSLAEHYPIDVDIVAPIPDSGNQAALGYYDALLLQGYGGYYRPNALFRPHTVNRTFIEPINEVRKKYLTMKFNPLKRVVKGKSVLLIDDSLVRGNTARAVVEKMMTAGACEVHLLVSSPMYRWHDFYGIDTYRTTRELIAQEKNGDLETMRKYCGLTTLNFLPLISTKEAIVQAGGEEKQLTLDDFYAGPFDGTYPDGTGNIQIPA